MTAELVLLRRDDNTVDARKEKPFRVRHYAALEAFQSALKDAGQSRFRPHQPTLWQTLLDELSSAGYDYAKY